MHQQLRLHNSMKHHREYEGRSRSSLKQNVQTRLVYGARYNAHVSSRLLVRYVFSLCAMNRSKIYDNTILLRGVLSQLDTGKIEHAT